MMAAFNSVNAIAGAGISGAGGPSFSATANDAASPAPFADLIADSISQVDRLEQQANAAVTGLMTGSGVDVHQAMIATEKASMAFELALAVRSKAVQAYQSVMGMQF